MSIIAPMPENIIVPEFTKTTKEISLVDGKDQPKKEIEEKISLPVGWVEKMFDNIFKSIAMIGGKHWELSKEEVKDLAVSGKPIVEKYLPQIIKYMLEMNFVLCLIRIIGSKAKMQMEIMKAEKLEQQQKEKEQTMEDIIIARTQKYIDDYKSHLEIEREKNAKKENTQTEDTDNEPEDTDDKTDYKMS